MIVLYRLNDLSHCPRKVKHKWHAIVYLFLISQLIFGCAESVAARGLFLVTVHGPLTVVASLGAEHGSRGTSSRSCSNAGSGTQASVVVAPGLRCSEACGSNLCLLHWQADSYPLYHQVMPIFYIKSF